MTNELKSKPQCDGHDDWINPCKRKAVYQRNIRAQSGYWYSVNLCSKHAKKERL